MFRHDSNRKTTGLRMWWLMSSAQHVYFTPSEMILWRITQPPKNIKTSFNLMTQFSTYHTAKNKHIQMEKSSPKENLRQNHSSIIIKLWHTFVRSIANTVFGKLFAINFAIICKFVTQFFTLILFLCTEKLSHFTSVYKFIIVWAGKCTFLTLGDCIQDTRNVRIQECYTLYESDFWKSCVR